MSNSSHLTLDMLDDMLAALGGPQFDTVLLSPRAAQDIRDTFPVGFTDPAKPPETLFGMRVVTSPHVPREPCWPEGCMRSQPWWLTDEAWAKHKRWMGDTFGWTEVSYLLNTGALHLT